MQMSAVPLAMLGDTHPMVGQVRRVLNVPGGNMLDRELSEILRGVQRLNGLPDHGQLDDGTLALFDLTAF